MGHDNIDINVYIQFNILKLKIQMSRGWSFQEYTPTFIFTNFFGIPLQLSLIAKSILISQFKLSFGQMPTIFPRILHHICSYFGIWMFLYWILDFWILDYVHIVLLNYDRILEFNFCNDIFGLNCVYNDYLLIRARLVHQFELRFLSSV